MVRITMRFKQQILFVVCNAKVPCAEIISKLHVRVEVLLIKKHTKGNHNRSSGFISDKTHGNFDKIFASVFSAYTTSILKIILQTNSQDGHGYKMDRFLSTI